MKLKLRLTAVLMCLLMIFSFSITANATEKSEVNGTARSLLRDYYAPDNCLGTCMYNIENCYSKQDYADKDQLEAIYAKAESLTANAASDRDKVKLIHDWMCTELEYSTDTSGYDGYPCSELANPFTVFKNRQGVCYGFSNLTELMLQHVGVPCVVVRGNYSSHVWNAVYLDGGWIFTDNTWDNNLTKENNISYRYYLMSDDVYDNTYKTEFIENWAGDICYFPVYVTTSPYHTVYLNSKGGNCITSIPFAENMDKLLLPIPEREGRNFLSWQNDHDFSGSYYSGFGGWYVSGIKGTTEDIIYTAVYGKVDPEYTVPTGLFGYEGDTLSSIELPSGFTWQDGSQILAESGTFIADYTPEDTDDYNIVKNINIEVTVKDPAEGAVDDANALIKDAEEKISAAEKQKSSLKSKLGALDAELADERDFAALITEDDLATLRNSLTDASDYTSKTELAYSNFKAGKGTKQTADKLLAETNRKISVLEDGCAGLRANVQTLKTVSFPDDLWENADTSSLEETLSNIRSSIAALEELEDTDELVQELTTKEGEITTLLDSFDSVSKDAETKLANIESTRSDIAAILSSAEAELGTAESGVTSLKARLKKASAPQKKISASAVSVGSKYCYTGNLITPKVTVKGLVKGRDYTVTYSSNRYVGTGKVTVKGRGNYTGTVTKTFRIVSPPPKTVTLSPAKNRLTIKVNQVKGIKKYRVSFRRKGTTKWSVRTMTAYKGSMTLKPLWSKRVYEIRVAALAPTAKGTSASTWSGIKRATVR